MDNVFLFRMTQPTNRSNTRSHCTEQTNHHSEYESKWKCNEAMVEQCKQRGVLCHIGLVRDHSGHVVNQHCFSVIEKCWKTTFDWNKHD